MMKSDEPLFWRIWMSIVSVERGERAEEGVNVSSSVGVDGVFGEMAQERPLVWSIRRVEVQVERSEMEAKDVQDLAELQGAGHAWLVERVVESVWNGCAVEMEVKTAKRAKRSMMRRLVRWDKSRWKVVINFEDIAGLGTMWIDFILQFDLPVQ